MITEQSQPENNFDNFKVEHLLCENNGSNDITNVTMGSMVCTVDLKKILAALFLFKKLEVRKVSQTALLGLINDIVELIKSKLKGFRKIYSCTYHLLELTMINILD